MKRAVQIVVSGKVQGVCFRAATQKKAMKLGITGWVKNLASGEVEIKAVADKPEIEQLIAWCHQGPMFARVEAVKVTKLCGVEPFVRFDILRD